MSKRGKFISVLGASPYTRCNYGKYKNCVYIQEALVRKHHQNLSEVIIFATKKSKESNWGDSEDFKGNPRAGLKETLEKVRQEEAADFDIKLELIPNGFSQTEIWEIFNVFVNKIESGDNIYFDVTHGFRHQQMLVMNILNYAKVLKNIKIKSIEYGLFEKLGSPKEVSKMPIEKRNAEIMDVTAFDYLNDWVIAVDDFLTTGRADRISSLSMQEIGQKLSSGKDLEKSKYDFFRNISSLIGKLKRFNLELETCRGNVLNETILEILKDLYKLEEIKDNANEKIAPFLELIDKIKDKFSGFDSNDEQGIKNYFSLINWCEEHKLVQQGLVIFRENFISLVAEGLGYPVKAGDITEENKKEINEKFATTSVIDIREEIASILVVLANPEIEILAKDAKTKPEIFREIETELKENYHKFIELYSGFKARRNDVSHFGLSDNSIENGKKIIDKFSSYLKDLENVLNEIEF